jgi:hypothetical protein
MSCPERDTIILAFALAANEGNIATEDLEIASSDGERQEAKQTIAAAHGYCHSLRAMFLNHCQQHGC